MSDQPPIDVDDDGDGLFVEEQRFAVVPEWMIDAELSDAAFRLYAVLLRYGNSSGSRMPSRARLAERLHRSKDSIDRALRELASASIVHVERRRAGRVNLTNRYHLRTSDPGLDRRSAEEGGRRSAATPAARGGGRRNAATPGGRSAARVAAVVRPDREQGTEQPPPPVPSRRPLSTARRAEAEDYAVVDCGIADVAALAERCQALRESLGRPSARWSAKCLSAAAQAAVKARGWPAELVESALVAVAADPESRSPMRVAEAGPWWDAAAAVGRQPEPASDLADLEARLDELDGGRARLQALARAELAGEGLPLTRATVVRRACELLDRAESDSALTVAAP